MTIPDQYKTDHLILLIGGNPLPNYVAARLLARHGATIWLLHSDGLDNGPNTRQLAERLEQLLREHNPSWQIKLEPIPDADNLEIEQRTHAIIKEITPVTSESSVGLNYTGGTKPMATHTYRAIEQAFKQHRTTVVYSYLDPRRLAMRIDRTANTPEVLIPVLTDPAIRLDLEQLAKLHGYTPDPSGEQWPPYKDVKPICDAIVDIHLSHPPKNRNAQTSYEQWMACMASVGLPGVNEFPDLAPMLAAIHAHFGSNATEADIARMLLPEKPNPGFRSCAKWFQGMYLEAYVKHALSEAAEAVGAKPWEGTTKFKGLGDNFDLDVSAMYGYQLFAISCQSTFHKARAKEHFLEVFVRSRQLGGDEARAALVCYVPDAQKLQAELARSWEAAGKLCVFGQKEIREGLADHFRRWFAMAKVM